MFNFTNFDKLLDQATKTAHDYLLHASLDVDKIMGDGYAKKNPELVAAMIRAASADYNHSSFMKVFNEAIYYIVNELKPLLEKPESGGDTNTI